MACSRKKKWTYFFDAHRPPEAGQELQRLSVLTGSSEADGDVAGGAWVF